jgi:U4/U6.U5 tri-snRNP-associated protein 1
MNIKLTQLTVAEERVRDQTEEAMRMDTQVKVEDDESGPTHDGDLQGGLEFDDTSEFVRAIQYNPVVAKEEQKPASLPAVPAESKQLTPARTRTDSPMETDEVLHELEAGEVVIKEEEDEEDEAMLNAIEAAINTAEAEMANGEGGPEAEVSTLPLCQYCRKLICPDFQRSEHHLNRRSHRAWRQLSQSCDSKASSPILAQTI